MPGAVFGRGSAAGKGNLPMRIVVAAAPKTGNVWLKNILASIYGLTILGPKFVPERATLSDFQEWVERGSFPDGAIFHQHYDYSDALADAIAATPAHLVTIVRDPYDMFVSMYFTFQSYADAPPRKPRDRDALIGKVLDDPAIMAFLADSFPGNLLKAKGWLQSGRAIVARYEDLHRDPIAELTRMTDQIAPVAVGRIEQAVVACSAENMRTDRRTAKHVRTATVGDWRNHLTEAHLAIFRERHADLIHALGYEVR